MSDNILLKNSISSLMIKFAIPAIISMVLTSVQSMIDGMFLGRYAGSNAMASVNIASPYLQIILGAAFIITTGTMSYLGRTLGEKTNMQKAKNIFKTAVNSLFVILLVLSLIGIFFNEKIALFLGANEVLLEETSLYIKISSFFAVFVGFMILFGFVARLLEKPQLYMISTIVCLVCNIVLDYIMVKNMKLGILGASLATGISYLIACLFVIAPVISKKSVVNIYEGKFKINIFMNVFYNGSSEGVTSLASAITMTLFNITFMKYAGENAVAAFTIIGYIGMISILVMFGMSDGVSSILSYNYGAKKLDRVKQTLKIAMFSNILVGVISFIILNVFKKELIGLFIVDNKFVLEFAINGTKIYSLSLLMAGVSILLSGYHTSIGNALYSIIISASRGLIFIVIGINILPKIFGIDGVWLTVVFAEFMTLIICGVIYFIEKLNNRVD